MSKHEIVSIIFRLINFAITIGAGFYLFKRYGLSLIQDRLKQKKDQLDALNAQTLSLEQEHQNLTSQQKYQTILFEQLKFKLSLWNTAFEKLIQERKSEKNDIKAQLDQKVYVLNNHLEKISLEHQVFPKAIEQSRDILEKKFASQAAGKRYLKPILTHIKKSAS
jgi:uncharacterized protein YicC (UPF0701 family)